MNKTAKFTMPLQLSQRADAEENPLITWMSFVFVDSEPNNNAQGVPQTSFGSLITSGNLMPVKMEEGKIGGHTSSKPLGVIRNLIIEEDKVLGEAALWNDERPSDIALLKESHSNSKPLDISFELKYSEYEVDAEGIEWILDPIVKGATIVTNPAYGGRTPVLSVASKDEYSELPDSCFTFVESGGVEQEGFTSPRNLRHFPFRDVEGKISETLLKESLSEIENIEFEQKERVLELLKVASVELNKEKIKQMDEEKIKELEETQATLRKQIEDLETKLTDLETGHKELSEYRERREREDAEAELLQNRLVTLTEAGFEFNEEQIKATRTFWLALDDEAFSSYVGHIQEVKKGASASEEDNSGVPDLSSDASKEKNLDTLRNYLDEKFTKKEKS